jgi:hypothetical protein
LDIQFPDGGSYFRKGKPEFKGVYEGTRNIVNGKRHRGFNIPFTANLREQDVARRIGSGGNF